MLYSTFVAVCISVPCLVTSQSDKGCLQDGVRYEEGESFDIGCTSRCSCTNGGVACISMCPPFLMTESCRYVKNLGECCQTGVCLEDTEKLKCNSYDEVYPSFQSPWAVRFSASEKRCTGTIIGPKEIITNKDCADQNDQIKFDWPVGKDWQVSSIQPMPSVPEVVIMHLESKIAFLPYLHESNMPFINYCTDPSCALYLTSVEDNGQVENVLARKVDRMLCAIDNSESTVGCLEIASYPSCPVLDGSGITVRSGDTFYLVGILAEGRTSKDEGNCDTNRERYRKYFDVCQQLESMKISN